MPPHKCFTLNPGKRGLMRGEPLYKKAKPEGHETMQQQCSNIAATFLMGRLLYMHGIMRCYGDLVVCCCYTLGGWV